MSLSVSTTSAADSRTERDSKERQDQGEMDVERAAEAEPKSPAGRLFREAHFNCYIVALLGLDAPIAAARAGLEATLVRHPHLCSVQDDTLRGHSPQLMLPVATKDNLEKLVNVGEMLLKKPVSRANLETGQMVPVCSDTQVTNEEALKRSAKLLSDEKRIRQARSPK